MDAEIDDYQEPDPEAQAVEQAEAHDEATRPKRKRPVKPAEAPSTMRARDIVRARLAARG